jgi:hypothetical protein
MVNQDWGLQKENLALDDVFRLDGAVLGHKMNETNGIIIGKHFGFPLDFAYEKIFIGGKTGSGKSYTAGVLMEEMNRHGIQFVCFDTLNAHNGIQNLPNVEAIAPRENETVNVVKLVSKLKKSNGSLVINLIHLRLESQQILMGDYCEALLAEDFQGKPIMTILEECQDFVPQMGKPYSFAPIVRLCKLGRGKGLGAALISQRPAAIHKEALSQVSTWMVHNIINTKDLEALKIQLSFGTDKETIKKVLSGISYAGPGEMVCFSPKYFKKEGYLKVGKVNRPRRTEHSGKNIVVRSVLESPAMHQPIEPMDSMVKDSHTGHFSEVSFNPLDSHDEHFANSDTEEERDFVLEDVDEEVSEFEWTPHDLEDVLSVEDYAVSNERQTLKAVGAIGLISAGVYLITRGLANRNG